MVRSECQHGQLGSFFLCVLQGDQYFQGMMFLLAIMRMHLLVPMSLFSLVASPFFVVAGICDLALDSCSKGLHMAHLSLLTS